MSSRSNGWCCRHCPDDCDGHYDDDGPCGPCAADPMYPLAKFRPPSSTPTPPVNEVNDPARSGEETS